MNNMLQHIRSVAPGVPVPNPFPMAVRIENTRAVVYFPDEQARTERAAKLLMQGVRVVTLPKILAA